MSMQMSSREQVLAAIVGAAAFIFVNFFVIDYFLKNKTQLNSEFARNTNAIAAMRLQLAEKPMWLQREAWLQEKQPRLTTSDEVASGQLLDRVKEVARENAILIATQQLRPAAHTADYSAISVDLDTTGTWPSIINFMSRLQGPEEFIVLEGVDLKIDDKDATQMRGQFKIAKWFAPKGR
jgi:hypothetical protein